MTYAAANRDPEVFEDPNEFIPGQKNITSHLGFGHMASLCGDAACENGSTSRTTGDFETDEGV